MNAELAAVIDRARFLLLDFDGPVCKVFANHSAPQVAAMLCRLLVDLGVALPPGLLDESDPLAVLRWSATLNRPAIVRRIDDALRTAELDAVTVAEPTPYAREVIVTAHQAQRGIAIVSNNSADAVTQYLIARQLNAYINPVIGRPHAHPAGMKPNPAPVLAAICELHADPEDCVLIGDSPTDIEAAQAVGVPTIGYANKPRKYHSLSRSDAIIGSMADVVAALTGRRVQGGRPASHEGGSRVVRRAGSRQHETGAT
ncbi:HAD family hydrolase [Micromonospora sp. NBC_01813]|uniref:HAD family hydrolase n=1 Tax=Micromonospora sp. NBC_01813 TaxID=2975988 RepID=UPI002DDAD0D1|nr:HAD-IA family hydrolase [Micromonospora sp. NBC_01813]WSA09487.1 HAD-IA family hydrolase [Micromonospora sp. NBC_01813]